MKFEQKNVGGCIVELSIQADAAEVAADYKAVVNRFVRNVNVPGFRKGKTPLTVVLQHFEKEIQQEVVQVCFDKFYAQAVKDSKLHIVALSNLKDVKFAQNEGFSMTAVIEVQPEFDLPKYKKLTIKHGDTTVPESKVEEQMTQYRQAFARYEEAQEGAIVSAGDFVQFDYSGTYDGKPLSELVPDQKAVCGAVGFWTQVEEGRFLKEILDALVGMKVGEEKADIKVKFPKDNAPDPIKGKTCRYNVAVKAIRARVIPDDAEFLKAASAESLDAVRADMRKRLEKEAIDVEVANCRNQVIEQLLKKADFDVPPSLVKRQTQAYLEDLAQRLQSAGIAADYVEQNRDKIMEDANKHAISQVRISYILAKIFETEKLEVSDADVDTRLTQFAAQSGGKQTVEELRKQLVENDRMAGLKDQIAAEKALDFVLAEAKK